MYDESLNASVRRNFMSNLRNVNSMYKKFLFWAISSVKKEFAWILLR